MLSFKENKKYNEAKDYIPAYYIRPGKEIMYIMQDLYIKSLA